MRRTRVALLALAAVLVVGLLSAGQAVAATSVIDARDDSPGSRWAPNAVTIQQGDTVRWEFDDALVQHNINATSDNWELDTDLIPPDGPPVEHTFAAPGIYTFLCDLHPGMSGTVTVEEADPLENVLVFSKTAGFRHSDSIPQGIAAIQQLGAANDFQVTATEDATAFTDANLQQFDVVVFLSTTGDVLNADQQAAFERYIQSGGGYAGIHAASDTEYTWPWYGELVGGYFRSHPPGTPTATVDVEDGDEPSTAGLPASWTRTDEWYNFQDTTDPVVNGNLTVADYSPRARGVHVLATVDEATYDEQDGNTVDDDHPVAWCSEFDGGRSWYTAMGHTPASFTDAQFRQHLLGGLQTAAGASADCGERRDPPPTSDDFEKVTLDDDTKAPMEIAPAPDGRVFYIELGQTVTGGQPNEATAELMVWDPDGGDVSVAHPMTVDNSHENGLLGLTLAPDFPVSGHLYMSYSRLDPSAPATAKVNVVSRFTVGADNKVVAGSEVPIYTWTHQRQECCHTGGSLSFGPDGSLYVSTGDNTNPFAHDYNPTDERPGREPWDAQRTSANTNNANGKVLRIVPKAAPLGTPGIGTTYDIPAGNMFPVGTAQTLPEIYAMGFRNPFRIHVDKRTGWVLLGDYGPDAKVADDNRGPEGSVEFNVLTEPGFYGWPYCVRENVAYNDITYTANNGAGTNNGKYPCAAPVNDSPNNTGLTNLPPAKPATMWLAYTEADNRFPGLGTGGAPTGGPRYYYDEDSTSDSAFPRFYDGQWFIGEWNNDWVKTATLNDKGLSTGVSCFAVCSGYVSPMDLEFGANGSLYVAEWGQGFQENNADSGVYRIDYVQGERLPIARAAVTPDAGPLPLAVQFSSAGSNDPDGTAITYAWDFDGDGDTDSTDPNPSHTYTTAGTFQAKLTVTDESQAVGTNTVTVVAGNSRPVVTVEIPENGKVADFGEKIPYKVSVTDAEDGSTGNGINCSNVQLEFKLGHDTHAHEISSATGCEGQFTLPGDEGHGSDTNVFTVIIATYNDRGAGAAGSVAGRAEAIVQPRLKQADFWQTTGRTADSRATSGDPGSVNEATTDVGAGQSAAFIEDGDWISFNPYNLEDLTKVTFRVASEGAGGIIELRYDAPDGPLVAATENIAPTGGWQTWRDVTLDLPANVPQGTHRLFLVFRHPTATGSLLNLNWFKFPAGKGAGVTAPPEVTASAEPASGEAPLEVAFDAEAVDPEGEALTYEWNFGVSGTTADSSTQEDPTYTYERPGNYTATVKVTDAQGARSTATVDVRVTRKPDQCPTGPARSDEFDGTALDTDRWTVLRPDAAHPFSVADGKLALPVPNGSMYAGGTSAKNVIVQPTPDGEWSVTAKITAEGLAENYQQAGLRVWSDDDHWASVHMISAGGNRDFEFIYENDGNPRNDTPDKLGGIPATSPTTYYVRLTSDGTDLTASYSYDGDTFLPVGRPAPMSSFSSPQIGPAALSGDDPVTTTPVAYYDWIRFDPDNTGGGSGGILDEFDGAELGSAWDVVRRDQALMLSGSALHIPAAPGDLYQEKNDAKNLVLRDAPDGAWTATAKVAFEGTTQWQQAGMLIYGDDNNFTKLGRLSTNAGGNGDEKFEFIYENNGVARNVAEDSTANLPAAFPKDYFVRITSDGTNITGAYSTDGAAWTNVGRPAPLPANAKIGLFAFSNAAATSPMADFDWFSLEGENVGGGGGGGPVGPSYDDQFDGSSLDKGRWNAIVRDVPAEYDVAGGKLAITTSVGDIYTGDTDPPPNNFILQSADHAGDDWVIETKLDGATLGGGYAQGGLLAYVGGDDYVKFDALTDPNNTQINRIELRSEVDGAIQEPQPEVRFTENHPEIWLRLTKTGTSYKGEYSFDGETWQQVVANGAPAQVTNAMEAPAFGLFAFSPQTVGVGVVPFEYFTLDGEDPPTCGCVSSGDEFDGTNLNKTTWNSIVREDESLYTVEDGALKVTTVNGDIYTDRDPAPTRNFFLQTPDHAGDDWVIETKVSGSISGGYEHGGLLVYEDDGNYIKYDLISDQGTTAVNRIELRSEEDDVIQEPQPEFRELPAGTTAAWLRLTKSGDQYTGEYSFDGETWTALPQAVQNDMVAPRFGIFTQGVDSGGGEVVFDYFEVDGKRGCEDPGEENEAPVLGAVTADPTSGFAPLPVEFTSDATDADEDELTYSWDFDGDGDEDADTKNASHTYAQAGVYNAKVTVSDGEDSASKTVQVTVLPADDPEARFRTLVFSKTTGFRHSSIPTGIQAVRELGEENDFQVDATEDASVFRDGVLAKYDTVVFLSTTGDPLNDTQQGAFERYVKGGGGYTGIHAAADTEHDWNWYGKLVGGYFKSHPPGTPEATVHVEDQDHHSTEGIPTPWERVDEWYNYRSPEAGASDDDWSPRLGGVHVLMTVDEATYDEQDENETDDDHPISWCQRYDGGRSWYTGMGHTEGTFSEPEFREHLLGGLEVSAGVVEDEACGEESGIRLVAFADPSAGPAPLTVNFSASGLDPDGDELTYRWEFPDGSALGASVTRTLRTPGPFTATVTARDADGNSASREVSVMVGAAESEPPVIVEAAADDPSGPAPHDVLLHAVAEDPEGGDLTYKWDFGDGGSAFGDEVEHRYLSPGSFTARVTVTDETGQTATEEVAITVTNPPGNRAPSVEAAAAPRSGKAPLEVLFTAQGTDPDGDTLTYSWDFGDLSAPVSGRIARHVYEKNGAFTATVTVTDRAGLTDSEEITITVGNPAGGQSPTVDVAADRTSGAAPLRVGFSAAGSDPDGDSILYEWDFGDGDHAAGTQVSHVYTTPGTYQATVTVTDVGGKTGTATVTITVSAPVAAAGDKPTAPKAAKGAVRALSVPSLGAFAKRGLKVAATCETSGEAAVGLWASKKAARKLGLKSRGLGRARFDCTAGQTRQLTLKPSKKVRRAIRAVRPRSLKITVALALRDGEPITRTVNLKRV
jgi:cytochrome c